MNLKDIKKMKGIPQSVIDEIDINPLQVIGSKYFKHPTAGNYRKIAINEVIAEKLNFQSNNNYIMELLQRLVIVTCPSCGKVLKSMSGGGNGVVWSSTYKCICGTEVSLTLPTDGISVRFKEDK